MTQTWKQVTKCTLSNILSEAHAHCRTKNSLNDFEMEDFCHATARKSFRSSQLNRWQQTHFVGADKKKSRGKLHQNISIKISPSKWNGIRSMTTTRTTTDDRLNNKVFSLIRNSKMHLSPLLMVHRDTIRPNRRGLKSQRKLSTDFPNFPTKRAALEQWHRCHCAQVVVVWPIYCSHSAVKWHFANLFNHSN